MLASCLGGNDLLALYYFVKICGLYVRKRCVCGYGYEYGYGWEISYPRPDPPPMAGHYFWLNRY